MPDAPIIPEGGEVNSDAVGELEDRVGTLEGKVGVLLDRSGTLRLPFAAWGVLWSILFSVIGGVTLGASWSAKFEERLNNEKEMLALLQTELHQHEGQAGHPTSIERLENLRLDVDDIDAWIEAHGNGMVLSPRRVRVPR
jgi:hypothetical protein